MDKLNNRKNIEEKGKLKKGDFSVTFAKAKGGFTHTLTLMLRNFFDKFVFFLCARKKTSKLVCGFTLIEFIVVIAVLVVLSTLSVVAFASFRNNQALSNSFSDTVSMINEAKMNTISSKDGSPYGVHFEVDRAVLFKGATFSEPNLDNQILNFSPLIEVSSITLNGGGSDMTFDRLTGKTAQYGSLIFRVKSDTSNTKTMNITKGGSINQN